MSRSKLIFREIISILFWIYILIKLFIIDVDILIVNYFFPNQHSLLYFRILYALLFIAIIFAIMGPFKFVKNVGYILIYPAIIIFVKLPKLLLKNSIFSYLGLTVVFKLLYSFKYHIISFLIIAICTIFILFSSNIELILTSIIILTIYICFHYFNKLFNSFKPLTFSSTLQKRYYEGLEKRKQQRIDDAKMPIVFYELPVTSKVDAINQFKTIVNTRSFLKFILDKLETIHNNNILYLYLIMVFFYTIFTTVYSFALINYGLYIINPSYFTIKKTVNIFDFFLYSFNNIIARSLTYIEPAHTLTNVIGSVEPFLGIVVILIVFVMIFTTIKKDKFENELKLTKLLLKQIILNLDLELLEDYSIDIREAILYSKYADTFTGKILKFFQDNS